MASADDVRMHREWLRSFVALPPGATVVDLGAGGGEDLHALAAASSDPEARFLGFDAAESALEAARTRTTGDPRIDFHLHRLEVPLPLPEASVDLVFSNNVLECLPDPLAFRGEIARVLRPGGTLVVAHWDWDSQLFDGDDRDRVRRLVHAFSDWQQPWMSRVDGWMGRRLRGLFAPDRRLAGEVRARVLINTRYEEPWFGYANAQAFRSLARRGVVDAEEVEEFHLSQLRLHREGRYFYSITGFAYVGRRVEGVG